MIFIAHRGNVDGPNPEKENTIDYIDEALHNGYHVEIDIWYVGSEFYLGHDNPNQKIDFKHLLDHRLFLHCKNIDALHCLTDMNSITGRFVPEFFWHQKDDFTLTKSNWIWTFPNKPLTNRSIAVFPTYNDISKMEEIGVVGICSDSIAFFREKFNELR